MRQSEYRVQSYPGMPAMVAQTRTIGGLSIGSRRMTQQNWTTDELRTELLRFERELRAANLKDSSIQTYVDRSGRFLKWLDGDYHPRGPN